jgi:hypothetical protein
MRRGAWIPGTSLPSTTRRSRRALQLSMRRGTPTSHAAAVLRAVPFACLRASPESSIRRLEWTRGRRLRTRSASWSCAASRSRVRVRMPASRRWSTLPDSIMRTIQADASTSSKCLAAARTRSDEQPLRRAGEPQLIRDRYERPNQPRIEIPPDQGLRPAPSTAPDRMQESPVVRPEPSLSPIAGAAAPALPRRAGAAFAADLVPASDDERARFPSVPHYRYARGAAAPAASAPLVEA